MGHCIVKEAEEILDQEFPVLNKGFVRLVDYMGSDERIVQAARVSYGSGTKTVRQDEALIDHLLRNEHTSPFEQVVYTFHIKMPLFVARQWLRHRTARLNEISGRYSIMKDEFFVPELSDICEQHADNKQGRLDSPMEPCIAEDIQKKIVTLQEKTYETYLDILENGTAREISRIVLPLSLYTEMYWQIDLHNLFRFIRLRIDPHAQKEIRLYAAVLKDIAYKVCPLAMGSFEKHIIGGLHFSKVELEALKRMLSGNEHNLTGKEAERFEFKLREGSQI